MEKQHKKDRKLARRRLVFGLAMGIAGLLTGYGVGKFLKTSQWLHAIGPVGTAEKILFLLLTFFAIWLVIALHELGHLTAGLAQGFRLALFFAGFLGIRGKEQGIQVFFNRDSSLMGGLAATFPEVVTSGPELRRKFAIIVVAGPMTSLALAIISLVAAALTIQHLPVPAPLFMRAGASFLLVLGFMSSIIFLATSLPIPSQGFMTDGRRFLSLLSGGETGLREEAGLAVMSLMGAGKLPGEYPPDLLTPLTALPPENMLGLNGHFVAFTHYLDREETAMALPYAESILSNLQVVPAGLFRRHYLKELVFFYAFLVHDAEKARSIWADIGQGIEKDRDAAGCRVQAAMAWLNGEMPVAVGYVESGLKQIKDLPFSGQRRFEEKWLGRLRVKINDSVPSNNH